MHSRSSTPSQRQRRVGEQLRHILAETLARGHFDSEILVNESHNVTVSEVRPSPDLKQARAYVMALGGVHMPEILAALNEEARAFQSDINRKANLKFTPRVTFVEDESFAEAGRIEEILRELPKQRNDNDGTA
jgi:ribosome-binding factor A